jgi:integrase
MASYQKLPSGNWSVRFWIIEQGVSKLKRLSGFALKREAEAAYRAFVETYIPDNVKPSELLFRQVFEAYKSYAINVLKLRPSTIYVVVSNIEAHILPTFADRPINKITRRDINEWQRSKSTLTAKYVSNLRSNLSGVFNFALSNDWTENNPVLQAEQLRCNKQKKEIEYWEPEEFQQFINTVDDFDYNVFFRFLYYSGCRKGEAFALRWNDVDFKKSIVKITKSYTKKGKTAMGLYGMEAEDTTKNKKSRTIFLPTNVMSQLAELKEKEQPKGGDYVFGKTEPLAENTVRRKIDSYISMANVKRLRVHDLRHSHVALIISLGESELATLYAVADRIGDTPEMILKTYGHLFKSKQREILSKLETVKF